MDNLYEQLMHQLARPMILVDPECRVLRINPAALRLIHRTDVLRVSGGILTSGMPRVTEDLHGMVRQALQSPEAGAPEAGRMAVALPRPDGQHPVAASIAGLQAAHPLLEGITVAAAAVWMEDPMESIEPSAEALRTWFGLTPAEGRIAIELTNGLSPKEIAARHGRHIRTVRTQVESIFRKLGVSRTAEVVRVITRSTWLTGCATAALAAHALCDERMSQLDLMASALL